MAAIDRIRVYPVKGLDGIDVDATRVLDGGTLAHDREFALFDDEGAVVNGKRTAAVHDLLTEFDPSSGILDVEAPDGDAAVFDLADERDRAARWFSDFFDLDLTLERDADRGYVDRREMGPSVISTASLRTVASWFDEMTVDGARRRLRANLEVSGVPAFWEDRFLGEDSAAFVAGDVRIEGVTPCGRCVVPQRDPDTGEKTSEFRERFVEKRRETFPDWASEDAFDHYYSLMAICSVPPEFRGGSIEVGDPVTVLEN